MKNTVIYHSADYDGIFCREIARKFLPDAELIGWNFGDKPLQITPLAHSLLYILDLPCDAPFGLKMPCEFPKTGFWEVIWIDHHKSAIESHPTDIPGYRIDGVAACRLAWQWFVSEPGKKWFPGASCPLPVKDDFINHKVQEPLAVRWAGEYDVWDKRDPSAETFQYGLRAQAEIQWMTLLHGSEASTFEAERVHNDGILVQSYNQKVDADLVKYRSYLMDWEGLKFLAINTARCNSLTFAALDIPETGHDALLGYYFNGKVWTVSLYHARHRTDLDLSILAVKHGGGGHRGACGFTSPTLPF